MNSRADEHGWWRSKEDMVSGEGSSRASSSSSDVNRKNTRHNQKPSHTQGLKHDDDSKQFEPKEKEMQVAEEFISQLGGAFLEGN